MPTKKTTTKRPRKKTAYISKLRCSLDNCGAVVGAGAKISVTGSWWAYDWTEKVWDGPYTGGYRCGRHSMIRTDDPDSTTT